MKYQAMDTQDGPVVFQEGTTVVTLQLPTAVSLDTAKRVARAMTEAYARGRCDLAEQTYSRMSVVISTGGHQ